MKIKLIYQWAVVGAGPAGIAAVGKLIDSGVPADEIIWIDPHFKVGDLGQYWQSVSSNTAVQRFIEFLEASAAFAYDRRSPDFHLNRLPLDQTCMLSEVVLPLQRVTCHLQKQVQNVCASVQQLTLTHYLWHLTTENYTFQAEKVVLATGADPIQLNHLLTHPGLTVLPLEIAMDRDKLMHELIQTQTYAVFGSSHSAMIVIRSLVELGVKKIINFYRSPCRYAIAQDNWILFDNTGLKGETAAWARNNIDGVLPPNLVRHVSHDTNLARFLPECQHVIYAVVFSTRHRLVIEGYHEIIHNPHNGIIGPGLFGLGIGFPEIAADPLGHVELQVGLWKFMTYLHKVLPIWLCYPIRHFYF